MRKELRTYMWVFLFWLLFLLGLFPAATATATTTSTAGNSDDSESCKWGDSSATCSNGENRNALKELLDATAFGRANDDSNSNEHGNKNAWHRPFLSFIEEHKDGMPLLSFLEEQFANNPTPQGSSSDQEKPFLSFLDAIQQTRDAILGVESEPTTTSTSAHNQHILAKVLEKARHLAQQDEEANALSMEEFVTCMKDALEKVAKQLQDNFGDLLITHLDAYIALAIPYFAMVHDATNSPLQKRKLHRFYQTVTKDEWIDLHDVLYLSQLAYVDTIEQFQTGLKNFENNSWAMLYGTTQSLPDLPASFLLLHKELDPSEILDKLKPPKTPLESIQEFIGRPNANPQSEVLVTLVVRGTKHIADFLQDGLLEPEPYKGGYAHGGILASGKNLAQQYLPKLRDLQQVTHRDRIKVVLIGHSLGAGAASIAAMELKEHSDFLDVQVVGFGCPSLLSHELSESTKDYILTVVNDADIVSRMSGASMTNILLDLVDYDWTHDALEDLGYSLERAKESFPDFASFFPDTENTLEWFENRLNDVVRPNLMQRKANSQEKRERLPSVLIPPGTCIHLFRDGYGVTGTYTPCDFFDKVEFSLTLIDDHLISTGYNRALLAAAQDSDRDYSFQFTHDVNGIVGV